MCHPYLADARLYSLLFKIDQDLAQKTKAACCIYCNAVLHVANYDRKPRGVVDQFKSTVSTRFSYSCAVCRRRNTPPSVRFLGRKVYLGVVVVLITAMRQGLSPPGETVIKEKLGVDRKTVESWKQWWEEIFPKTDFWTEARRQLAFDLPARLNLPLSILNYFHVESCLDSLCRCLRFLAPVSALFEISLRARLWPC
jgi:hypothetical protein